MKLEYEETINNNKEESIRKAIEMIQNDSSFTQDQIRRPNINTKKIIFRLLVLFIIEIVIIVSIIFLNKKLLLGLILINIVLIIITIKKSLIDLILLYQKYAPEKLRQSCLFEPTCSEYMILSIKKYGAFKGVHKGIRRLLRCHSPNGGIDYP